MHGRRAWITAFFAALAVASSLHASVVQGRGPGGSIPPGAPLAAAGTFTSTAVMPSSGIIATGNAVTVILRGFQHDWAGDLIATLSYVDSQGNVIRSANLFSRLGQTANQPDGTPAGFGVPGPTGDNYTFNSDATGNLWTTAAGLGFADTIPGLQTDQVNGGVYSTTDPGGASNNLSYAFAGLDAAGGTWRLTIVDASDHAGEGGTLLNAGSLVSWEVDVQTEPLPSPDFNLWASSSAQNVSPGGTATYTVALSPVNGFTGSAALSTSWLPAGASAVFNPNPLPLSCNATTATLSIATSSSLAPGSYTFTITAQSGPAAHSVTALLNVTASAARPTAHRVTQ